MIKTKAGLEVVPPVGVVFHGTEFDFRVFRDGITWFTPDRKETIAQYRSDDSRNWFIFHATLILRRPADLDDDRVRGILKAAAFDPDQIGVLSDFSREVVLLLENHGYDGLTAQMGDVRHYAAFHPAQIRTHRREVLPAARSQTGKNSASPRRGRRSWIP